MRQFILGKFHIIARAVSGIFLASMLGTANTSYANIIHEERSLYRNILISEQSNQRCMRFVVRDASLHNQSCIDLENPRKQVFEYTKMLIATLAVKPQPERILIVGLGGGTLPKAFHELLPSADITSVEIDPAVIKAAKKYFDYQEGPQVKTVEQDARVYIKRAQRDGKRWDLVVLDAFNGDYIPEHLMTREFLTEVKQVLNPAGLIAANTFATSRLYHHESVTYAAVFPHLEVFSTLNGNRILLAAADAFTIPNAETATATWQSRLAPYDINIEAMLARHSEKNWDNKAKILTDQFAPANLLKH